MNRNHHIDRLFFPEARFVDADGTVTLVQPALPEEHLRNGRVAYDHDKHHMKLKCPHCDVRVDFNKGSLASGGITLAGARPHFKKARGQEHEPHCILPHLGHQDSDSRIDDNAGYRVHLNTFLGGKGNPEHPVYQRTQGGKVEANDPRLQPEEITVPGENGQSKTVKVYKESLSVRSVGDLIQFMRTKDSARIKQSLVVHNDTITPWCDFAIVTENRLKRLVDRLLMGVSHPVLMYVGVYKDNGGPMVNGNSVFYKREDNQAQFIVPHIYKDGRDLEGVFDARGHYLVLGIPRLNFNKQSGAHIINISLKSADYVAQVDISQLTAEARVRADKKTPTPNLSI